MKKIAVLTYNQPHRKTYDTICLLMAKGKVSFDKT